MSGVPQLLKKEIVTRPLKEANSSFPGAKIMTIKEPVSLSYGGSLSDIRVAYETYGALSENRDNVILLCPAFSAHSHACSTPENPDRGWWEKMVGPGLAIDTDRFLVVCASLLGSCYGTTGPTSIHPQTGAAYASKFPIVTIRDMVDMHIRLLDHLEIDQVHAVIGGSMGAMQVVDMAIRHPHRMRRFINISGTGYTRPYTAAVRHLGRRAIMFDPAFNEGNYGSVMPVAGLRLAREIGTLFYRSREEFNERFTQDPLRAPSFDEAVFDVQSYLNHQGNKIVLHFDPNSYLYLSMAMDLHDVRRGFASPEEAFSQIQAEALTMGVKEDNLITVDEQRDIHDMICKTGGRSTWMEISSRVGHDAFLAEEQRLTPIFQEFLHK